MQQGSAFISTSDRSRSPDTKQDSFHLPSISEYTKGRQQESGILQEGILQRNQHNSFKAIIESRYAGEEDNQGYRRDEQEGHQEEQLYQLEGDGSSVRETTNLDCSDPVIEMGHDSRHESSKGSSILARGAQDSTTYNSGNRSRPAEFSARISDTPSETSVSSRSESSNQSTPRSLATSSVSEQAESLNSKASTVTVVSDTESSVNSDKTAHHNIGMIAPPVLLGVRMTQSGTGDWHNFIPASEHSSSRLSHQFPISCTFESQNNATLQGSTLPHTYSASQPQEQVGSQYFSSPRDSKKAGLEDRARLDASVASGSGPWIPPDRGRLSGWNDGGDIPREPS